MLHSIDWGERVSQPISKVDEPVYLEFSRRNFTILRVTLEQETTEKHVWPQGQPAFEGESSLSFCSMDSN